MNDPTSTLDTTADFRGSHRVELRSDTFTLPTPEMLRAMGTAELGDDVYGEDPTVRELEELSATILGKESGCLLPSGTMANLASILTHCPRGAKAIVGAESDIYIYEAGGASVCGGVVYHPVPNLPDGTFDPVLLDEAFPEDQDDPQFALPALLCLENPQNRCGGRVLPLDYLRSIRDLADSKGIAVHLDGARIFNAAIATVRPPAELAGFADSLQFCLSKGLGAPAGSVVVGSREFVTGVRRVRKMLGGGMRQSGVLAAAGLVALRARDRLRDDHEAATRLADGLAALPGIEVEPVTPRTNMVYFRVTATELDNATLITNAESHGVGLSELGRGRIRCATHCGVTLSDIDHVIDVIASIMAG